METDERVRRSSNGWLRRNRLLQRDRGSEAAPSAEWALAVVRAAIKQLQTGGRRRLGMAVLWRTSTNGAERRVDQLATAALPAKPWGSRRSVAASSRSSGMRSGSEHAKHSPRRRGEGRPGRARRRRRATGLHRSNRPRSMTSPSPAASRSPSQVSARTRTRRCWTRLALRLGPLRLRGDAPRPLQRQLPRRHRTCRGHGVRPAR
jgi:hypothetical protein